MFRCGNNKNSVYVSVQNHRTSHTLCFCVLVFLFLPYFSKKVSCHCLRKQQVASTTLEGFCSRLAPTCPPGLQELMGKIKEIEHGRMNQSRLCSFQFRRFSSGLWSVTSPSSVANSNDSGVLSGRGGTGDGGLPERKTGNTAFHQLTLWFEYLLYHHKRYFTIWTKTHDALEFFSAFHSFFSPPNFLTASAAALAGRITVNLSQESSGRPGYVHTQHK